jgi:hypothetical protein
MLLELEILVMFAREQEIQQRGKCELFSGLGCGRWCHPVEQGTGKLRLVIERNACARDAGVVRAGPRREREVEENDAVVTINEDVPRMDVAMHDAACVQPRIHVEDGNREA